MSAPDDVMKHPAESVPAGRFWRIEHPLVLPLVAEPARPAVEAVWALDARLAELAAAGREPALRQIRLRWWADQLASLDVATPPPEPLLRRIARDVPPARFAALALLAEAWFDIAGEEDGAAASRGAELFAVTSCLLGGTDDDRARRAGSLWGAVDAALTRGSEVMDRNPAPFGRLPRPLAALAALARFVARRDGRRAPRREQLLLLRVGLFGR